MNKTPPERRPTSREEAKGGQKQDKVRLGNVHVVFIEKNYYYFLHLRLR